MVCVQGVKQRVNLKVGERVRATEPVDQRGKPSVPDVGSRTQDAAAGDTIHPFGTGTGNVRQFGVCRRARSTGRSSRGRQPSSAQQGEKDRFDPCGGQKVDPKPILRSSCSSIVMVQAPEDRVSDYSLCSLHVFARHIVRRVWYPLIDTLVWTRVVEIRDVFADDAVQVSLTQDQQMIQAFSSHASNKPLTDRIGFRRSHRSPEDFNLSILSYAGETLGVLAVVVSDQKAWSFVIGGSLSDLLGDPDITR